MITKANVGQFLADRHPGFMPLYQMHVDRWGAVEFPFALLQSFAQEFMVPLLRTGTATERTELFATVEQLLADGDEVIYDVVDHQIVDELVYVGYTLKNVDVTGARVLTQERIDRTRNWRPGDL